MPVEMLKFFLGGGDNTIIEWMFLIYDLAWIQREVLKEWKRAIITSP